jgi:hypothetical protein
MLGIMEGAEIAGNWWTEINLAISSPVWSRYEEALARTLIHHDWLNLRNAFSGAVALQTTAEFAKAQNVLALTPSQRANIAEIKARLEQAQSILSDLTLRMEPKPRGSGHSSQGNGSKSSSPHLGVQ